MNRPPPWLQNLRRDLVFLACFFHGHVPIPPMSGMVLKVLPQKMFIKKGYHVTEACVLTASNHPVSIFSHIHSSQKKDYKSANTITFHAIEQGASLFGKATFAMDRGYDDNKMFLKLG